MPTRYYSSTATATTLTTSVSSGVTSLILASVTGFPVSFPYTLILDSGTPSEELVDVTAASGTTLTVTRGVDGTTGVSHSAGASVAHGVSGRDFQEAQASHDGVFLHWSSYSAAWTSTGTAPAIGNGTISARYKRIGDTVSFHILLQAGSTTTFGTGTWLFSLPAQVGTLRATFPAIAYDNSDGLPFAVTGWADGAATTLRLVDTGAYVGATSPFSWQTSDTLQITGTYEAP